MPFLVAIAVVIWVIFGSGSRKLAEWIFPNEPAPWESVTAYYYPDRHNLYDSIQSHALDDLTECRRWVRRMAALRGDPNLRRGDYECAIGNQFEADYGFLVYRQTVR